MKAKALLITVSGFALIWLSVYLFGGLYTFVGAAVTASFCIVYKMIYYYLQDRQQDRKYFNKHKQ